MSMPQFKFKLAAIIGVVASVLSIASAQADPVYMGSTWWGSTDYSFQNQEQTTLDSTQSAAADYNYYSWSGHPEGVSTWAHGAGMWVHQDTTTGEYSFGMIFSSANSGISLASSSSISLRVVGSDTATYVAISDENKEMSATGADAYTGNFVYKHNSDGFVIGGITGDNWSIIIDDIDYGDAIKTLHFFGDGGRQRLYKAEQFLITNNLDDWPEYNPDGDPVVGSVWGNNSSNNSLPEPGILGLLGLGLIGVAGVSRKSRVSNRQ